MKIQRLFLTLLASLALSVVAAHAAPTADSAKARANEVLGAMKSGDYAKFVDYSDPTLVEQMGGKDKLISSTKDALAAAGITITAASVGEAGEPKTKGDITYVVVPTAMTMETPTSTISTKGFLLGISRSGADWKFIDGAAAKPDLLTALGLDLPAELTLPDAVAPTVTPK